MGESFLHFIETPIFIKQIDKLASLEILFTIQNDLQENPERGDIIPGTNGARKARVGDKAKGRGKSGAFRYIYAYFINVETIYLFLFYAKNQQANLGIREKKEIAELITQIKKHLRDK